MGSKRDKGPKLWVVKWGDAHGQSSESELAGVLELHREATYYSVGVLVKSDETGVTIAQDYGVPMGPGDAVTYRTRTFILRSMVRDEWSAGLLFKQKKGTPPVIESVPIVDSSLISEKL